MGRIWSHIWPIYGLVYVTIYGPCMGPYMAHIWPINRDLYGPCIAHIYIYIYIYTYIYIYIYIWPKAKVKITKYE